MTTIDKEFFIFVVVDLLIIITTITTLFVVFVDNGSSNNGGKKTSTSLTPVLNKQDLEIYVKKFWQACTYKVSNWLGQ
jgi:hypothetical protein